MSLENNIQRIADALESIALSLSKGVNTTPVQETVQVEAPKKAPKAPVEVAAPVVAPTPAPVAAMPPVPTFTPVAVAPVAPVSEPVVTAPAFANKQAMMDFVISSYKALGAEKGAAIQNVLTGMGYNNINDVPDTQWGQLKSGIEALK